MADLSKNGKKESNTALPKMLICPARDLRVESKIEIAVAENLLELVTMIDSDAYILSISDIRLVSMMVKFNDMFGVEFAVLTGVPGSDYNSLWDNETWSLDRVGYDTLVVEAETADMLTRLKQEEGPSSRARQKEDKPLTKEDVSKLKLPSAFDVNAPDSSRENDANDDE